MNKIVRYTSYLFAGIVLLALLALLTFVLLIYAQFFNGLQMMPSNRTPSPVVFSDRIQKQFSIYQGYGWPPKYPKLRPGYLIEHILLGSELEIPPSGEHSSTQVWDTADFIMYNRKDNDGINRSRYSANIKESAGIWLSRNWRSSDALNTILAESYFGTISQGKYIYGLNDAANFYFGLAPDELLDEELLVLYTIRIQPDHFNAWCGQEEITSFVKSYRGRTPRFDRLKLSNRTDCSFYHPPRS